MNAAGTPKKTHSKLVILLFPSEIIKEEVKVLHGTDSVWIQTYTAIYPLYMINKSITLKYYSQNLR